MKLKPTILILLLLLVFSSFSQKVSNIHFEQVGKQIHIYYDLEGGQEYTIQVFCSTNNGQIWGEPLKQVTGAVGENQKSGISKDIIWNVIAEREKLSGEVLFKVEAVRGVNIQMVFVKGGTFRMGSDDGDDDEKPTHMVRVDDFYIGKYEVTQKQWKEIMGNNPSYFSTCDNCPVENVSWNHAQDFIRKLNQQSGMKFRLPTEAEWEFAARGGNQSKGYTYSGSNNLDKVVWHHGNSGDSIHQVGTKAPNELGIYDMSGNVAELCHDWYDANYYSISPKNNPLGPVSGDTYLVLRGGSWFNDAYYCRVAIRFRYYPIYMDFNVGFRLVR